MVNLTIMNNSLRKLIVIAFLTFFAVFVWGIFWHNSSLFGHTLYRGPQKVNQVALTFDDGPHPQFTPLILDILRDKNVKATFFCVGYLAQKYPDIVKRIQEEGHLVASHSYEHNYKVNFWGPNRVSQSLIHTGKVLNEITGYIPRFYRAPIGIRTPAQGVAVRRLGMTFVGWSSWTFDGGNRFLEKHKVEKLVAQTQNGKIFLLHDGKLSADGTIMENGKQKSALSNNLPLLIEKLKKKGFSFVTIENMFDISGSIDPELWKNEKLAKRSKFSLR